MYTKGNGFAGDIWTSAILCCAVACLVTGCVSGGQNGGTDTSSEGGDANADSDADSDTDSDGDADADGTGDTDTDADNGAESDSDSDSDSESDSDSDSDADADADSVADADIDSDKDADTTEDTYSDGDTDADSEEDTDADGDTGTDADADGDTDADSDTEEFAVAGIIYVAPDGDDTHPGTLEQPLKTMARARDLVRTINSAMTEDITVYLRAGTYPLTRTLTFSNADSGRDGFYVKYMAYEGERPLITGGQPITGWELLDAANDIYSANAGTTAFRQLYVNGQKAVRARTPNLLPDNGPNFYRLSGWDKDAHNVQVPSSAVGEWNHLTKVEMHIMIAWGDSTLRIASISSSGGTAYMMFQPEEDAIVFVRPNPRMDQLGWGEGRAYYFENALEFLDQQGEWYLDETTNTVYYKPRDGEDMASATVIAPMVETLMSVEGTSTSDPAGYLRFEGLTFAHSTFMRPSDHGFLDAQAGQYNLTAEANNDQTVGRPPAGVRVMNANHIHFERNLFTQMGATGLDFVSGTQDDMIIGNVFTEIAGNGFSIGKFTASETTEYHVPYKPTDDNEICTRDTFKNNYINRVTTEFQGGCGIAAGYPAYLTIEHNEVSHTNYTGISVGYGWTDQPNAMTHNKINYNNIHHVNEIMTDGGAIYTLSNQDTGSEIQYNYIHDYSCSQWADYGCNGLYLDEQTSGYTVAHNVLIDCPTNVAQNRTGTNTIVDNGGNPSGAEDTIATAGIEPGYADIKNLSIPPAEL